MSGAVRHRGGQGRLTLDFTSVGPDAGGVGIVAMGLARGLLANGVDFRCAVSRLQHDQWTAQAPDLAERLRPVTVALAPTSRWQRALRRSVPSSALAQRAVGAVRSLRAGSTRRALRDGVVWLPFHRVPLASSRGVVTVHDLRVFEPQLASPMDQRIVAANVREARAVVCSWPHPFRSLVERFPAARGRAFLVPLPVLNPGPASTRTAPTGDRPLRLLFPGYVTPHKNHEVIVRALPQLPGTVAIFTGAEDGGEGDRLRALAGSLGVAGRIEWRGFVSAEELEAEYRRADLLAMPTRWEAASGPVYEAIARELPFVASEIPPVRAQLDALGLAAETFPWDSPDAFATAVRRTLADYPGQIERLRRVAATVRERTWAATAADYGRVFAFAAGLGERPDDLMGGDLR